MISKWKEFSSKLSISTKLSIIFFITAFIPLVALGGIHVWKVHSTLKQRMAESLQGAARITVSKINTFLMTTLQNCQIDSTLPVFARYLTLPPDVQQKTEEKRLLESVMNSLTQRSLYGVGYELIDTTGIVLVDSANLSQGQNRQDRNYFKIPVSTGHPYISNVVFVPKTGQAELFFCSPVYDSEKKIVGLLCAKISAGVLHSIIARAQNFAKRSSFVFLVDSNSITLACSGHSNMVFKPLRKLNSRMIPMLISNLQYPPFSLTSKSFYLEKVADILGKPDQMYKGFEFTAPDGIAYFAVGARTDFLPWSVVFARPVKEYELPVQGMCTDTCAVGFLVVVLSVFCAMVLGRRLTRPVMGLVHSARQIAQGDLDAKVYDPEGSDELSVLADGIRSMQQMIKQKVSELKQQVHKCTKTQSEFKKAQALLKTAVEQSLAGFIFADSVLDQETGQTSLKIKLVNSEALRILGLPQPAAGYKDLDTEAIKQLPIEFFNEKNEPIPIQFLPFFEAVMFSRKFSGCHIFIKRPDSTIVHTVTSACPVKDGAGNTIGGVCTFLDMSEIDKIQNDLNLFKSIPDFVRFGVVISDKDDSILYVNDFFSKMYGKPLEMDHNKKFLDFFSADGRRQIQNLIRTAQDGNRDVDFVYTDMVTNSDKIVPCMISASFIDPQPDGKQHIAYTLVDISELKQTEKMLLEAKQQAERASIAKNRFLASISHEIRTPMNAIIGFSQILKQTAVDDEQTEYVDTIMESGNMLLNLIENVLDIAKIEAGQVKLQQVEFYLQELVETAIKIVSHKFQKKDVELFYNIALDCPHTFHGDPDRIKQIIINLLTNAIKFTDHGRIDLIISSAPSHMGVGFHSLKVSVKDTGVGIPAEKQQAVFNVFEQAHTGGAKHYEGSGLGLSIVKNLVELMHGNIQVSSEPGRGTEFSFNIELVCKKTVPDPFMSQNTLPSSYNKAIIVMANPVLVRIVHTYASQAGLEIIGDFKAGADVFNWNASIIPDIVLCSAITDNRALKSFMTRLKKHYADKPIKFIVFTKNAENEKSEDGIKGHAVLVQPIIKSDFFKVIRYLVQSSVEPDDPDVFSSKTVPDGSRVLLVDDNVNNRNLLALYLRGMCSVVETAENGKEAVNILRTKEFDVILMDVLMPRVDGIEATRIIREEINAKVPIIGITADLLESTRKNAMEAGMTDYILKPVTRDKLLETIRRWGVRL